MRTFNIGDPVAVQMGINGATVFGRVEAINEYTYDVRTPGDSLIRPSFIWVTHLQDMSDLTRYEIDAVDVSGVVYGGRLNYDDDTRLGAT